MGMLDQLRKSVHKSRYYVKGYTRFFVPRNYWKHEYHRLMSWYETMPIAERMAIDARVNYYCKLQQPFAVDQAAEPNNRFTAKGKSIAYVIDYRQLLNYFPPEWKTQYLFGDITKIPSSPHFLKSRPVTSDDDNANSILLKLNQIRHYYTVNDKIPFALKQPRLVWRGKANQPERNAFLERFFYSKCCDIGDTAKKRRGTKYSKSFMSISEQLRYKYLLSIEGYDVATNTKWIMASNSLCLMRKPRFETWYMEGALIPNKHYVLLQDDYGDLEEKIDFYEANPLEAQKIIHQANIYAAQFFDEDRELLISLLVMRRYFFLSGQCAEGWVY